MPIDVPALLERLGISAKGTRWLVARCPNPDHNDSSPSWRILDDPNDSKREHGKHHCFGCGFGGWPVNLVETVLGCTRAEAWDWLKGRAEEVSQAPVTGLQVAVSDVRLRRHEEAMPPGVVFAPLAEWPTPPRRYAERRGLTAEQVERWRIGYGIGGEVEGRVVLVARDETGRVLDWTARDFAWQRVGSERRRHRHPTRRGGPDPGALFGEEHWPERGVRCVGVVTEAAWDALAIERATGFHIGALFGSATKVMHPRVLMRLASWAAVLVATDGDEAGEEAFELIRGALSRHTKVRRVPMPAEEDVNEMERRDVAELRARVLSTCSGVPVDGNRPSVSAGPGGGAR